MRSSKLWMPSIPATATVSGSHRSVTTSPHGVADGAFEPHDAGVSEYGQKVIERMNQVGMAVGLGHASDRTKLDACEMSKAPVILSHGTEPVIVEHVVNHCDHVRDLVGIEHVGLG